MLDKVHLSISQLCYQDFWLDAPSSEAYFIVSISDLCLLPYFVCTSMGPPVRSTMALELNLCIPY